MDDGIGRSGARLMALTFFAIGALGVLVFWNSTTELLQWTAAGVILGSAFMLFAMVISLTRKPREEPVAAKTPQVAETVWEAEPAPRKPVAPKPVAAPRPTPAPTPAPPAPMPAPTASPAPAPTNEPEVRAELRERYTQNTQLVKEILNPQAEAPRVPRVVAQRWTPRMGDATPAGTTRGRCSQCQAIVVAPTARPIDLACPVCENVTRLKA